MKKFLSLVLAMIMALSLVTISAGAVEYADLTDTDEITYEEAVSVLNKIGIIEGYPDGSYKPQAALTRQVAAKFIVSLLIGPSAAENLTVAVAPYPDVPASSQFAGYISYCKTAGIISGYSDGTFKPEAGLTGYAFSKMLLGALGYKSEIEGFTGTGYTMNVARIGNAAGLFNRIEFQGGEILDRETAAQLCLNTLKATMVEYSGGFNITSGDATIVGAQTRSYVTSNQEYATHIDNRKAATGSAANATQNLYTVEFGEEHFKDLRMDTEGSVHDAFGRPSTEWSWKMVTFGTFPLEPDFVFTSQVIKRDDNPSTAAKIRALGMNGFTLSKEGSTSIDTTLWVNGDNDTDTYTTDLTALEDIADWTDNGTLVECYIDLEDDDFISDVVVIRSQLMKVKKVGSDYVSLEKWDDNSGSDKGSLADETDSKRYPGFNQSPLNVNVEDVEINDACYEYLSALKAGDRVVIIPKYDGNNEFIVGDAYVPETVSGELTWVDTYAQKGDKSGDRYVTALTLGGTKYNAAVWNFKIINIDANKIDVTRKDVTLTLDAYGNAMLAEDVGSVNDYIVISNFYTDNVNRRNVSIVEGFDMDGNKVELNVGAARDVLDGLQVGDLVRYTNSPKNGSVPSTADWVIQPQNDDGGKDVEPYIYSVNTASGGELRKYHTRASLMKVGVSGDKTNDYVDYADGVKFVYVNFNSDESEVESVQIVKGAQGVTIPELEETGGSQYGAQAYTDGKASPSIKAIVIKDTGTLSSNVLYIRKRLGAEGVVDGKRIYKYEAAVVKDGVLDENTVIYSDTDLRNGDFATWAEDKFDGVDGTFYKLRRLQETGRATSAAEGIIAAFKGTNGITAVMDDTYYRNNTDDAITSTDALGDINLQYAYNDGSETDPLWGDDVNTLVLNTKNWVNMTDNRDYRGIDSAKSLKSFLDDLNRENGTTNGEAGRYVAWISFVFNDKFTDDAFRTTGLVVLNGIAKANDTITAGGKFNIGPYEPDPEDAPDGPLSELINMSEDAIDVGDDDEDTELSNIRTGDDGALLVDGTTGDYQGDPNEWGAYSANGGTSLSGSGRAIALFTLETPDGGYELIDEASSFKVVTDTAEIGDADAIKDANYILITTEAEPADPDHREQVDVAELTAMSGEDLIDLFEGDDEYYAAETGGSALADADEAGLYTGLFYVQVEVTDGTEELSLVPYAGTTYKGDSFDTLDGAIDAVSTGGEYEGGSIYTVATGKDEDAAQVDLEAVDLSTDETNFASLYDAGEDDIEEIVHPNASVELWILAPIEDDTPTEFTIHLSRATIEAYAGDNGKIMNLKIVIVYDDPQSAD